MENSKDYLIRLKQAVEHLHNCSAYYVRTEPIIEAFKGDKVWKGNVEVFALVGHPKAKRCYAWSHLEGEKDEKERFFAVLEIPPVDSALRAVQVQVVKDARGK